MRGEPKPRGQQGHRENKSAKPHIPKLDARQVVYQYARKTYEATKRLVKRLRESVGRLTISERIAAVLTAVIAGATVWNVVVVQNTLPILRSQVDEMRDEQRPWVFAQVIGMSGKVARHADGMTVPLSFVLTNSGHLPASYVWVNLEPISLSLGVSEYASRERTVCNDVQIKNSGIAIFPNFTAPPWSIATTLPNDKLEAAIAVARTPGVESINIAPYVIACIKYKDPSGTYHHTPYVLKLVVVKDGQMCCAVPVDPKELAASEVVVQQYSLGDMPPD
jgi:hypothetical protein